MKVLPAINHVVVTKSKLLASKIGVTDVNGDGIMDILDCPHEPGSREAKSWFENTLVPHLREQITSDMYAKYGTKCVGAYHGKPLVPGVAGKDQGDFLFLRDRIQLTQGVDKETATLIAGHIKVMKYGER